MTFPRFIFCCCASLVIMACQQTELKAMDQKDNKPAHHTKDGFQNIYIDPIDKGPFGYLKMKYFGDKPFADHPAEAHQVPIASPDKQAILQPGSTPQVSWLGHSTFLIQYQGVNVLTDPILSERASPVSFAGPERLVDMPIEYADLPDINYVIISHNHYDHLDGETIEMLGDKPFYLVPLGLKAWFVNAGIQADRVVEMDWWDEHINHPSRLTFTATPCQHWSARGMFDRYKTLWAAWHIQMDDFSVWFGGDTGYNEIQFKEIGERWGGVDLGLIPIGAYAPRWFMKAQHVDPDEAILIHQDIKAKKSIGMHWGTFQLSAEPMMEPVERIEQAVSEGRIKADEFVTMSVGETIQMEIEGQ